MNLLPGRIAEPKFRRDNAFTLIEVVLAVAIFAIAAVSGLALFSGLIKNAGYIRDRDGAIRLSGALDDVLRDQQIQDVYNWLKNQTPLYAYTYLGSTSPGSDGEPVPQVSPDFIQGGLTLRLVPVLRPNDTTTDSKQAVNNLRLTAEMPARQGALYRVKLLFSNANYVLNPNTGQVPSIQDLPSTLDSYLSNWGQAKLVVSAEFYPVQSINTQWPIAGLLPVHVCTITYIVQKDDN